LHSDNPGGPDSHTVMHTFEIKPSSLAFDKRPNGFDVAGAVKSREIEPDELLFRCHRLPKDSEITIYFSDIDTAEIQHLAALRNSPLAFTIIDRHTLKLTVSDATWMPIPGGRTLNIPALLSVKLPDTVKYGEEYRISIHQVSGRTNRIIGSCEFQIPVSKAELILEEEIRDLSVFRHILTTIPTQNRWHDLIKRYTHHLGLKVDALGGDARSIHPNPDGTGRPYDPKAGERPTQPGTKLEPDTEKPRSPESTFSGLVHEIFYDCHGRFEGFMLESCNQKRAFRGCEPHLEQLVLRACKDRLQLTVVSKDDHTQRITVQCC
jgi:hypothetical protein